MDFSFLVFSICTFSYIFSDLFSCHENLTLRGFPFHGYFFNGSLWNRPLISSFYVDFLFLPDVTLPSSPCPPYSSSCTWDSARRPEVIFECSLMAWEVEWLYKDLHLGTCIWHSHEQVSCTLLPFV